MNTRRVVHHYDGKPRGIGPFIVFEWPPAKIAYYRHVYRWHRRHGWSISDARAIARRAAHHYR
jgi:hypothetical protein